jgi:hypothetical protein
MTIRTTLFRTLEELRGYVNQVLCEQDQLEPDAFPLTQRLLLQKDRPCGMYYCLHGPRQVRFSAVWDAVRNIVLFYGASGERFQMTKLLEAPELMTG